MSFAATELAVAVARSEPSLSASSFTERTWATDLLVLDHGHNPDSVVVAADDGRWDAA